MSPGKIYIGTSGWHYPHWVGPFYPPGMAAEEFLAYYARRLDSVEINNTFYHLPARLTWKNWREETPQNFLFTCKASRFITHMKKLKDPKASTIRFFRAAAVLKHKLGPILFQLPPRWRMNAVRLEEFLKALPKKFRYAFEFRDETWFDEKIYQLLMAHNAAFCLYHLAGRWSPEIMTADFVYIRLHGPEAAYQGRYDAPVLRTLARKCSHWAKTGKDVYCYFDNDERGFATANAVTLRTMVKKKKKKMKSSS